MYNYLPTHTHDPEQSYSQEISREQLPIHILQLPRIDYELKLPSLSRHKLNSPQNSRNKREREESDFGLAAGNFQSIYHSDSEDIQQPNSTFSSNNHRSSSYRPRTQRGLSLNNLNCGVHRLQDLRGKEAGRQEGKREQIEQDKRQTPFIATRNILQFFWKVLRNYFNGKNKPTQRANRTVQDLKRIWEQMGDLKPSLNSFTKMFQNYSMRKQLKKIFLSRYFMREIILSGLKQQTKTNYLRYVKILLKGFLEAEPNYLN